MPELPEVETTVKLLKPVLLEKKFLNFWTNTKKLVKEPKNFKKFIELIKNKKITEIKRVGKNILINLENKIIVLIHQKLSGHLLVGKWRVKNNEAVPQIKGPLMDDPMNKHIRAIFYLNDGKQLALADLRKFAKILALPAEKIFQSKDLKNIGPDALEIDFDTFKERIKKSRKSIKQVLMDQKIIAGIGNIYSDEILWEAKIHPLKSAHRLKEDQLKNLFKAMKKVLKSALEAQGTSIVDYRKPDGTEGKFGQLLKVYHRQGEECLRCGTRIKRYKLQNRSGHYCPNCQRR